jgi:hypothetical protein
MKEMTFSLLQIFDGMLDQLYPARLDSSCFVYPNIIKKYCNRLLQAITDIPFNLTPVWVMFHYREELD